MSRFRKLLLIVTLFSLIANVMLRAENEKDHTKRFIQERLGQMQNLTVSYTLTKAFSPPPSALENLKQQPRHMLIEVKTGTEVSDNKYYFLHNKARYECYFKEIKRAVEPEFIIKDPVLEIFTYPGDRVESLRLIKGAEHHQGTRRKNMPLPFSTLEFGLGLRMWPENTWLSIEQINKMQIVPSDASPALVSFVDSKNRTHEWRFDPKLAYAPISYRILTPPPNKRLNIEFVAQDFKRIDGIMLPHVIKFSMYSWDNKDNTLRLGIQETAEIEEYKLNDPNNTSERYNIKWPKGTRLHDTTKN